MKGTFSKQVDQQQKKEHQGKRSHYDDPKPLGYLLLCRVFHFLIFDYGRKIKNFPQQILKIWEFVLYFAV